MARDSGQLLSPVAFGLACPICLDSAGSLLADGARAGATVLALVAAIVLAGFVRFAWRLIRAEAGDD
jgi:hypothetical protein